LLLGAATVLLVGLSRGPGRPVAAVLLAFSLPFAYHAVNGLETALAALLLAALVLVPPDVPPRRAVRCAASALLAVTRPEGLLAVLLWTAALLLTKRRLARHDLGVALAAGLAFLAQLAFRWTYYGDWIANSARAKILPLAFALPTGLADLGRFVWHASGWGVLLLAAGYAVVRGGRQDKGSLRAGAERRVAEAGARAEEEGRAAEPWPPPRALGLFLPAFGLALAASGGDSFPLWRFYVPLLPLFYILAEDGLVFLWEAAEARRRRPLARIGAVAAAALLLASAATALPAQLEGVRAEGEWVRSWSETGDALKTAVPPATRLALCPVGALPYHAGLPILDMLGLTDRHIARTAPDRHYVYPGHQRHDAAYVLARRPELVLLANGPVVAARGEPFPWHLVRYYERDLATSPRFRRAYRVVYLRLPSGRYLQLFARQDAAARLDRLLP
jgi:hypothetical protein